MTPLTMTPGREILANIPAWMQAAMYGVTLGATAIAAARVIIQVRRWRRGHRETALMPLEHRLRDLFRRAVAQHDIAAGDRLAGLMHRLIFWGFAVAFLATVLTAVEHDLGISFLHGGLYLCFAFVTDLFGLMFVCGLLIALYRRFGARLAVLSHERSGDTIAVGLLLLVGVSGFLVEGARIAAQGWPAYERLSFVGWASGLLLAPLGGVNGWAGLHRVLWGVHVIAVAGLFLSIPFTRLMHVLAAPANILLRARPLGALRPVVSAVPPVAGIDSFTWKQLLELDACTSCGRCSAACPAGASGKPLSPMLIVQHLREVAAGARDGGGLIGDVVDPDALWSCTTCGACEEICPVAINHIDRIVDLRRVLVDRGDVQASAARAMESMLGKGNPWDAGPAERPGWAERTGIRILRDGEPCETIYWVGCAGSCDEHARKIAVAVAGLLKRAGVDFGILGAREGCSGDMARRLGEEGLFAELARRNLDAIRAHRPRRILTHCPHCLNAFLKEYPLDGVEIIHHSVFLGRLLDEGRLQPTRATKQRITFHDPCYLGRYNGIYDAPRAAIATIPDTTLMEMPRHRSGSFCCGGGGGQMFLDVKIGERIPTLRFREAQDAGANVIATACPFCKIMLASVPGERGIESNIAVKDVAELLAEACQ